MFLAAISWEWNYTTWINVPWIKRWYVNSSVNMISAWITWFLPSMMVKTTTPMIPRYFTMSSNCAFYYCFFERTLDAELHVILSYFLLAVWWPLLEGGHNCGPGKPFYTVTLIRGSTNKLDLTRAAHSTLSCTTLYIRMSVSLCFSIL